MDTHRRCKSWSIMCPLMNPAGPGSSMPPGWKVSQLPPLNNIYVVTWCTVNLRGPSCVGMPNIATKDVLRTRHCCILECGWFSSINLTKVFLYGVLEISFGSQDVTFQWLSLNIVGCQNRAKFDTLRKTLKIKQSLTKTKTKIFSLFLKR